MKLKKYITAMHMRKHFNAVVDEIEKEGTVYVVTRYGKPMAQFERYEQRDAKDFKKIEGLKVFDSV